MAATPGSAIDQIEKINENLSRYFSEMRRYVSGAGEEPSLTALTESLDYSELHRLAYLGQSGSSSYMTGTAIEAVHQAVSVIREADLANKSKVDIYNDGVDDMVRESDYYAAAKTRMSGTMKGMQ